MKAIFFLFLFLISFIEVSAQGNSTYKEVQTIDQVLTEIKTADDLKAASIAFLAIDVESGEVIAELNPNLALKPASTLKVLSTATALELLGPSYEFTTKLAYSGIINNDKKFLNGNIYIIGGGDPSLGSKYFNTTKNQQFLMDWVNAIKSLGVDSISGRIISDASYYSYNTTPSSWSWTNMGNYFGAGPNGLSVYDNYYTIYFNTGNTPGESTKIKRIKPSIQELRIENTVTSESIYYDNSNIFGAPYSNTRKIRGSLPLNKKMFPVKGSIPDPALLIATQLDSILRNNIISVRQTPSTIRLLKKSNDYKAVKSKTELLQTFSPPLKDIIAQTNRHSVNLFAEHLLIASGNRLGAIAETDVAADSVVSFWRTRGMNTQGLFLYDGSGLSHQNAISPRQLLYILRYMKTESLYFDEFYNSLPRPGQEGTLDNMMINSSSNRVHIKSGSLNHVKAYTGYITTIKDQEIAFSIIINNYSGKSKHLNKQMEKLIDAMIQSK